MNISKPGVYNLIDDEYHADPVCQPSMSSSIIKTLLEKSPRHAWQSHPRLNPAHKQREKKIFDLGSAAHDLILCGGDKIVVIDADSFRTTVAKNNRDKARTSGKTPILKKDYEDVKNMSVAFFAQFAEFKGLVNEPGTNGKAEQTLIWQEGDIWCRSKLDWLPDSSGQFIDYKSTAASANPEKWGERTLFDIGADIQAAFYLRGIRKVLGRTDPEFIFAVQENTAPYAMSLVGLTPATIAWADKKIDVALNIWRQCISSGEWPGYANEIVYVDPPAWKEKSWLEREARIESSAASGKTEFDSMIHWQAPLK